MSQPDINNTLTLQLLKQQKRDRLWRNIRFFIGAMLIFYIFFLGRINHHGPSVRHPDQPYVSLIRLNGEIMPGQAFSARFVLPELQRAFADPKTRGVVLDINSPGGSPVQASIIHDKILELKRQYPNKKVSVVAEDSLASGAYLVAVAADNIYVNASTVTGSIGVVMRGFGFEGAISKLGITRRVFTSGISKSRLDSFEPLNPQDIKKAQQVLDEVHRLFISDVVLGRGKRLQGDPKQLFSGDFWTGAKAVSLGLADGTGNLWQVLKNNYHVKQYKDFTPQPSLLQNAIKNFASELHVDYRAETAPHLSMEWGN